MIMQAIDFERKKKALETATFAFWKAIADAYPEATHGDLDLLSVFDFATSADDAVENWIHNNVESP